MICQGQKPDVTQLTTNTCSIKLSKTAGKFLARMKMRQQLYVIRSDITVLNDMTNRSWYCSLRRLNALYCMKSVYCYVGMYILK